MAEHFILEAVTVIRVPPAGFQRDYIIGVVRSSAGGRQIARIIDVDLAPPPGALLEAAPSPTAAVTAFAPKQKEG